jgi:acetyltransferase-like isoleucine patch superfamily enzyme
MQKKLGILQRAGLRFIAWALQAPEHSGTHLVNKLIYTRYFLGKALEKNFKHPQVEIGAHSYGFRRECFFPYSPDDRVAIGKFCSIADGVRFVFGHHPTNRVSTYPFNALCFGQAPHADSMSKGNIVIGNDVWLGLNVVVLSGVEIGDGAVIAAGAVVNKSVPSYSIYGGVPAKFLKHRLSENQIPELLKIQWWDWPIEKIKENEELFYGDVDEFIKVHHVD